MKRKSFWRLDRVKQRHDSPPVHRTVHNDGPVIMYFTNWTNGRFRFKKQVFKTYHTNIPLRLLLYINIIFVHFLMHLIISEINHLSNYTFLVIYITLMSHCVCCCISMLSLHLFDCWNWHDCCPLYEVQKAGRLFDKPAIIWKVFNLIHFAILMKS